jgi:hypothetical protein
MAKKKQETIHGLTFKCVDCGQRFVVGKLGIEAVTERVKEHVQTTGHMDIPPIKAVKGLTYASSGGEVAITYNEEVMDWEDFLINVKGMARRAGVMYPQLALA